MSRVPLTGGAYQARSVAAAAQRSVNLFSEPVPEAQGEPMPAANYPTPGTRLLGTVGPGPIRGIRQATTGGIYCVSGNGVYKIDPTTWAGTHLGDLTHGLITPVSMVDNGLDMVFVDGSANGWHVTLAGDTFAQIDNSDGVFMGATRVDYLDTYFLFNKPNTPQFYSSDSLALTFDPLWFANKESYSDLLRTLVVVKRDIWLFGDKSTEIFNNVGKPDFPFESAPDIFIDHGIAAVYSVAEYDNGVFWLSADRQGHGIIIMGSGYQTKRISTYAIENEVAGYEKISDAIGFCYQIGGHSFYVLTFPAADKTWSYDITTQLWHEWVWIDTNGDEHRHRSNCYWPINGVPVVGDWQNGNLYALDHRVFTDFGGPIKRVRGFPHSVADGKRVFYRQFLADMDTGNPSSPAQVVTSIETIITWLPNIASLTGLSVGAVLGVFIDWPRGFVYVYGQTGYQKYATALLTQAPLVTMAMPSQNLWGADVDPLSGDLIVQGGPGALNGQPIRKLDPNTFAVLGTFGVYASPFPSYPTSVWAGQSIVCVVCNGVTFGFLKYSEFFGTVAGFRVDTMQHSGFLADIVAGSIDNRGFMIAGKSGGTTASVFLSWDATTTPKPSVPLYRIDIAASATAYNPASWPTPNPGITWTTVGNIPVASVDPAWTGFTVFSIGYDLADGNVLMLAGSSSSADGYRVLKLNALTAAVMWNIATGMSIVNLGGSRINGSLWMIRNPGALAGPTSSYRINTLTGTIETQPITGFFASTGAFAQQTDSQTSLMFYGGTFNSQTGAANPVAGTGTFSNGWAFMGGQTTRTTVEAGQSWGNLISLRYSDDRGHTWSNPITQDIGAAGDYLTSLQWQRLGMSRWRVFELFWSVPTATALQGCYVDATPAGS